MTDNTYLGNGEPINATPNPSCEELDALVAELRILNRTPELTPEQTLRMAELTELIPRKARELDDSLRPGRTRQ